MAENFYIRFDIEGDVKRVLDSILDGKNLIGYSKVLPWVRDKAKAKFVEISYKNISIDILALMKLNNYDPLKKFAQKFCNVDLTDKEIPSYFKFVKDKFINFDFDQFKPYRIPMKYIEFLLERNTYEADSLTWSDVLNAVRFNVYDTQVINSGKSLIFKTFDFIPEGYLYLLTEVLSFKDIPFNITIYYSGDNLFTDKYIHGRYVAGPHYIYDDYHKLNTSTFYDRSMYMNFCRGIDSTLQDVIKLAYSLFDTEFYINNPQEFTVNSINKIFGEKVGNAVYERFKSMIL